MHGKSTARRPPSAASYGWLWPGMPPLWDSGRWFGFAAALGFALVVELLLLTEFVWNEWIDSAGFAGLSVLAVVGWIAGIVMNRRWSVRSRPDGVEDLFPRALDEYLQGNWFQAEQHCRELMRRRRDDVEARLLLATLLRHTDRRDEARAEIEALAKFDGAAKWALEITSEQRILDEAEDEVSEDSSETTVAAVEMIRRAA